MVAWTVKNANDRLRKGNRRRRCRCQNTIKGSNGGYQVAGRLAVRNKPDFRDRKRSNGLGFPWIEANYMKKSEI